MGNAADALRGTNPTVTNEQDLIYFGRGLRDIEFIEATPAGEEFAETTLTLLRSQGVYELRDYLAGNDLYTDIEKEGKKISTLPYSRAFIRGFRNGDKSKPFEITMVINDLRNSYNSHSYIKWIVEKSFEYQADVGRAYCLYSELLTETEIIAKAMIEFPWTSMPQTELLKQRVTEFNVFEDWAIKYNYNTGILQAYLAAYAITKERIFTIDDFLISLDIMNDTEFVRDRSSEANFSWAFIPTDFGINVVIRFSDGEKIDCMITKKTK